MSFPAASNKQAALGTDLRQTARKSGRPVLADAELLTPHILHVATQLFVLHGYAGTTMDLLAKQAGVSKKTIYARFSDKNHLFDCAVREHLSRHLTVDPKALGSSLNERLYRFGCHLLEWTLQPEVLGLYRVAVAESPRFPQLARLIFDAGVMGAHAQVLEVLNTSAELKHGSPAQQGMSPSVLASHFLNSCIAPPFWLTLQGRGEPGLDDTRRAHLQGSLSLFLHGALGLQAAAARKPQP